MHLKTQNCESVRCNSSKIHQENFNLQAINVTDSCLAPLHRQRTCNGFFSNSLRPISYLGYTICVRPENKGFFVGKTTKSIFPLTSDSQCQNSSDSLARNTPMPQNLSAQFFCPSPKVWDISEKKLRRASVVRPPLYLCADNGRRNAH